MKEQLIDEITKLRNKGYYNYVLVKYVNRDFWLEIFNEYLKGYYIDNLTDFNYATCFTFCINISDIKESFTSTIFRNYLKNNDVFSIYVEISAIAPYASIRYQKRMHSSKPENELEFSDEPYIEEQKIVYMKIKKILELHNIRILDSKLLSIEIPNIKLELRESHIQVYHCLFQDEYYFGD